MQISLDWLKSVRIAVFTNIGFPLLVKYLHSVNFCHTEGVFAVLKKNYWGENIFWKKLKIARINISHHLIKIFMPKICNLNNEFMQFATILKQRTVSGMQFAKVHFVCIGTSCFPSLQFALQSIATNFCKCKLFFDDIYRFLNRGLFQECKKLVFDILHKTNKHTAYIIDP